jgi:hypothetical protein
MARGRIQLIRAMVVILVILVVVLLACAVLYLPEVSTAIASVTEPTLKSGLKRSITKTTTQLVVYPLVFIWILVLALRRLRST